VLSVGLGPMALAFRRWGVSMAMERAELDRPRSKEEELPAGQGLGPDPAALASPGQADLAFPIQVRGLHVFAKSDELAP